MPVRLAAWFQASRPLAAAQMLAPLGFGMSLAWADRGAFRGKIAWLLVAFTLLDQLVIVFANDVADLRTDLENRTHNRFSGGSRVIAEGKLSPLDLGRGALVSLLALGAVSAYLALVELRAFMVVLAAIAAHLLWMYSFPPFRLSYRGHGEILQALGLGAVLPLAGYYGQTGDVDGLTLPALAGPLLLGWAGNVLTALPDRPSDEASGKRSLAVRRGEPAARRAALLALALAV
ncbi:MAG: prenyltransferase, partial [Deltaproteobacteria bacterium]|nr:prenyltransferase [Deltaproteobacteria bacterium]